ncbi:M20/M25/M40 family metallo-hydrolase [Rhodoligotrophos defluvii]|uniref:M20/M25/M40 family metallo-hydrolase n=1 Tax=Rhodoligotrophos defluvii TaxID=2561934 RepID=UPI0010C967F0|nr:M20/M25/M40 family metallo-hydrolase [Rhodoligotrophos defluvii]
MDVSTLACDPLAMIERLKPWIECESPTFDATSVNRMMDLATADLQALGAEVERIPGKAGFGDCVLAHLPHGRRGQVPGVLVMGHLDTVHPVGTLAKLPFRIEGPRCYGPGILDMKGGCRITLEAIAALQAQGVETPLPVSILFTSDEEVGSPSTRPLIEATAQQFRFVLVPEPAMKDGGVTSGRYAIARFNLRAHGRPSHAGAALKEGRSAIRLMTDHVAVIEDMTTDDCTFSVGVIRGGQWVNCVSTSCEAEVLSMAKRQADLDTGISRMLALNGNHGEARLEVELGVVRPVWEPDAGTMALYEAAREIAESLGVALSHGSVGGGSDGNFTGAIGIPTLDGLGLCGAGYHTLEEHIEIPSLALRTRLMAGLLHRLS